MDHSLILPEHDDNNDNEDEDLPLSHPARRQALGGKHKRNRDRNRNHEDKDNETARGGWGESMELAHQREREWKEGTAAKRTTTVVAVDLNQFRNTEVGTGYKARHVVRQRSLANSNANANSANFAVAVAASSKTNPGPKSIINGTMNRGAGETMGHGSSGGGSGHGASGKRIRREELLRNDGLRAFRREIETILSSSSSSLRRWRR